MGPLMTAGPLHGNQAALEDENSDRLFGWKRTIGEEEEEEEGRRWWCQGEGFHHFTFHIKIIGI